MLIKHNQMRMVRKRTGLVQEDIAYILRCSDYSSVSRWEQGIKVPPLQVIILYHILFEIPVEFMFQRQKRDMSRYLGARIRSRVNHLRTLHLSAKATKRISYLENALTRLEAKLNVV